MTIWDRYGWTNCHPDYPWWACEPTDLGANLVRSDGMRVNVVEYDYGASVRYRRRTGGEMTDEVERIDRERPLTCPQVCAGQIWHFPKHDIDLLVVRRQGNRYWMLTDDEDENGHRGDGYEFDEWDADVPVLMENEESRERGWLVYGPGAPWAPAGAVTREERDDD